MKESRLVLQSLLHILPLSLTSRDKGRLLLGCFCNCDLLDEAGKGRCISEVACNACN